VARALLALALIAVAACGRIGGGPASASIATARPVGVRVLELVDTSRQLDPSRRGGPATNGRPLPTTVLYPAKSSGRDAAASTDGAPFPLVVFSHGLRGLPDDYTKLLESWAGRGYVVAAPAFPLTNTRSDPVVPGDLTNQPGDVSFVIASLVAASADAKNALAGMVDAKKIVAAGHSEGAITTALLFAQCCTDTRLAGAIVMAGDDVGSQGKPFTAAAKPVLFIHGDADKIVPYELGMRSFNNAPEPKAFLTLVGAGHLDPYVRDASDAAADSVREATAQFLAFVTGSSPADARAALRQVGTRANVKLDDRLR
jgi:fermentation-respiration switch protein FrsA (DUF1100 family)